MRSGVLVGFSVAVLALAGAAWWVIERPASGPVAGTDRVLPGVAERIEKLERLEVHGAGDALLVAIEKHEGRWRMPDRLDWPANQREVSRALFRLAEARRLEAKTANPELHARLGVEAVAGADAKGTELRLIGGGEPLRLTIGKNHPSLGGSYVRIGDEPQVWLLDEDIGPARNPADWLDRRLVDLPLARVAEVRVTPAKGRAFRLTRADDDRFSLDGQPSAALGNADDGNATAASAEQLALDDLAVDAGAAAEQTLAFESVDGVTLTIATWQQDGGTWARLSTVLDKTKAAAWFAQPATSESGEDAAAASSEVTTEQASEEHTGPSPEERLHALEQQVAQWQQRFDGKQFLLPPQQAANLVKNREDYLAGSQ
jgi:hypothetical protein